VRICGVVCAFMFVFWMRVSVCLPCWLMFVLIEGHGCWMWCCVWGGVTAVFVCECVFVVLSDYVLCVREICFRLLVGVVWPLIFVVLC